MKGNRKGTRAAGIMLGLAAMCAAAWIPRTVYGAGAIDTEKDDCRILFTRDIGGPDTGNPEAVPPDDKEYYGELSGALDGGDSIAVSLYRVAEVDAGGHFRVLADYRGIGLEEMEEADSGTTAREWAGWAESAAAILGEKETADPEGNGSLPLPDGSAEVVKGEEGRIAGTTGKLRTGMYLVLAEPLETESSIYRFLPFLVSLPGNDYGTGGNDVWNYGDREPVEAGLKPEKEDLYGNLSLEKKLTSYNETLKGASFVFEVKAVKAGRLVYSDVVSLNFDGPGSKSHVIEKIPAGAEVTVTEVYSGAGYSESTGNPVGTAVTEAGRTVQISFENEYDGHLNGGGTGVVNHFTYGKDGEGNENLAWEKQ